MKQTLELTSGEMLTVSVVFSGVVISTATPDESMPPQVIRLSWTDLGRLIDTIKPLVDKFRPMLQSLHRS